MSAAKYWRNADKHIRLNLFYADRIEKYISKSESEGTLPDAIDFVADSLVPNPFGVVPVFHFANNADIGKPGAPAIGSSTIASVTSSFA